MVAKREHPEWYVDIRSVFIDWCRAGDGYTPKNPFIDARDKAVYRLYGGANSLNRAISGMVQVP